MSSTSTEVLVEFLKAIWQEIIFLGYGKNRMAQNKWTFQKWFLHSLFTPFLTVWILLSPFSFDLCFSSLSSFHYRSRSLCSSVIILWQISFDHRKSKERCITILAPLPILNDDHLCSSTYYQLKSISNYRWGLENLLHLMVYSTVVWLVLSGLS